MTFRDMTGTGAEGMQLDFYFAAGSCSLVGHSALEELGIAYRPCRVDLAAGEQRRPGYLAINRLGRVPAIVADGQAITESLAILGFLDALHRGRVLPADAMQRGRAIEHAGWFATAVQPTIAQAFRPERYTDDEDAKAALRDAAPARLERLMLQLEERLAGTAGDWIAGDLFCAVDVYSVVLERWARRLRMDMGAYPHFIAHSARVLERAAVQRALAMETATAATATPPEKIVMERTNHA